MRMNTKEVKIGSRVIGGNNPILIQSMTNTKTEDAAATIAQIRRLEDAGCEIVRCAVPTLSLIHIYQQEGAGEQPAPFHDMGNFKGES